MSSSSALPPLGNLPSWSRVSTLDRSRYPKPFLRDRLQTLPPAGNLDRHGDAPIDIQILDKLSPSNQHRVVYYNKNISFLQQQHADTLQKLHEEIDRLKQENKDLQFKLVMRKNQHSSHGKRTQSAVVNQQETPDLQNLLLQEEIKDLKQALKNAQGRNSVLQSAIHGRKRKSLKTRKSNVELVEPLSIDNVDSSPDVNSYVEEEYLSSSSFDLNLPYGATLSPLKVNKSPSKPPRVPSLEECETIIEYLHKLNLQQSEENSRLKADLVGIVAFNKSHRNSSKSTDYRSEEAMMLPKVTLKQTAKHHSAISSTSSTDKVSLPALKQTLNTNVADRRKRQQAVQKARREGSHHI